MTRRSQELAIMCGVLPGGKCQETGSRLAGFCREAPFLHLNQEPQEHITEGLGREEGRALCTLKRSSRQNAT
jgi:hypothetical protein